jgi:uncharacterized protein YbaR (Trm112 family)
MDHRLLEIIACPVCNGKLYYSQDKQELICKLDSLAFPLRDGIPVLLENEARSLVAEESQTMSFVVIIPARYSTVCRVSRWWISTASR